MAISYPGISYLRGYEPKDPLEQFAKGFGFGEGIRNEAGAKDALSAYIDSLTGGQQQGRPAQSPGMVRGSHDAAIGATDPMLQAYFQNTRRAESGGNDAARNPNSSATGRYQFIESTWNDLARRYPQLGLTPDGRTDPAQQERAMQAFTSENARTLSSAGIGVNPGSLYAAHFLGPQGAVNVLGQADDTPIASIVGREVVDANPFLANMTVGSFREWAGSKGGNSSGGYSGPAAEQPAATGGTMPRADILKALVTNPLTREFGLQVATGRVDPAAAQRGVVINGRLVNPVTGQVIGDFSEKQSRAGLQPVWGTDEAGNAVLGQMSDDGRFVPTALPEGVRAMDPRTLNSERAGGSTSGRLAAERDHAAPGVMANLDRVDAQTDNVLSVIDTALEQAGMGETGLVGAIAGNVRGTKAYDLRSTLTTIKANLGFAELQAMRDASPTGGALGQVAVQELEALQSTLASLDPGQSEAQLRANLEKVKVLLERQKMYRRAAAEAKYGAPQQPTGGSQQTSTGIQWSFEP